MLRITFLNHFPLEYAGCWDTLLATHPSTQQRIAALGCPEVVTDFHSQFSRQLHAIERSQANTNTASGSLSVAVTVAAGLAVSGEADGEGRGKRTQADVAIDISDTHSQAKAQPQAQAQTQPAQAEPKTKETEEAERTAAEAWVKQFENEMTTDEFSW